MWEWGQVFGDRESAISPLWNMAAARRQPYSKVAENKGRAAVGVFPGRPSFLALFLVLFLALFLALFVAYLCLLRTTCFDLAVS